MNERIKQLMNQAGTDTSGKWMGVDHAEKFAELIVKKCAELCLADYDADIILAHFGVEE
jgi:hypothetical protein